MDEGRAYLDGIADGIAQGRREAAEAYCDTCEKSVERNCPRPNSNRCRHRFAILGTASDEKTDKGAI
jgi:hypothetical protein